MPTSAPSPPSTGRSTPSSSAPGVSSPEQLRGDRIGINGLGGAQEYEAYEVLARYGIGRGDTTISGIGSDAARLQAMQAGAIDAAVIGMPFDLLAEDQGMRVLVRLADLIALTHGVGTGTAKLQAAPDEVRRFLRASDLRSVQLTKRDKPTALRHMIEWLEMTPDVASRAYDAAVPTWSDTGVAPEAGLRLDLAEVGAEQPARTYRSRVSSTIRCCARPHATWGTRGPSRHAQEGP